MTRRAPSILVAGLVLASTHAPAWAQAPPDSGDAGAATTIAAAFPEAPGAPASVATPTAWRAWTAALARHGAHVSGSLTGLWIGDVAGGLSAGGVFQSLAYGAVDLDLSALAHGWRGGRAFANVAFIRGRDLSARFVGDALVASNLEAYPSLRLYDAWIEQAFASGRASLRLGSQGADEEFAGTDGGGMLTNSAFGWQAGIGANVVNGGPIYFAPALGARLAVTPAGGWVLRAGAYDGDSFDSPQGDPAVNAHGLHFSLSRAQGVFLIAEGVREWKGAAGATPGRARLGAWRHTADFADDRFDAAGAPLAVSGLAPAVHHGNHGAYATLEQVLWRWAGAPDAGVDAWVRGAVAPADRSTYSSVGECGMRWSGLLPARPADALGVAFASADVSPALHDAARDAAAADAVARPLPDWERVLELAWQFRFGAHATVSPDLQWILLPGATGATPAATVAGLRASWQ